MSQEADLFTRLAPVLNVRDPAAERTFCESLGLPVIYEGPKYPEFIGFGTETVHFGIQKAAAGNDDQVVFPGRGISQGPGYPSSLAQYPPPPELEGAGAPDTAATCHTPPDRFRPLPLSCPGAESPM
jgi:hypothetical protein